MYVLFEQDGRRIELPGRTCTVLVGRGALASEKLTMGVTEIPPHTRLASHVHSREDEAIYVMEGEGVVEVDGKEERIGRGAALILPSGSEHLIENRGSLIMRFVFAFSPPVVVGSYDRK
jgi:quercetin dioxygenase-like cupin family protein